jgi:hypothetical protein
MYCATVSLCLCVRLIVRTDDLGAENSMQCSAAQVEVGSEQNEFMPLGRAMHLVQFLFFWHVLPAECYK